MTPFTQKVIQLIKSIPAGHVMTYGQIATWAGSPRAARQVVRILHSMSQKYKLPWHRVINSKGQIGLSDDESYTVQRLSLEMEGIEFTIGNRIDLEHYQFHPEPSPLQEMNDVLQWVVESYGDNTLVLSATPLKGGMSSTMHDVELFVDGEVERVVLRQFTLKDWLQKEPDLAQHEAESLTWAALVDVPTPRLIAYREAEVPSVLMSKLPGTVDLNPDVKQLAQTLVRIHQVPAESYERRHFTYSNHAALEIPEWSERQELWREAIQIVQGQRPESPLCLIHRDYHPTNVLWQDGQVSGVVDWVGACRGPAGIDVGHCRLNLALLLGVPAADEFLDAYLAHAGDAFTYEPYWDLVSLMEWLPNKPSVYVGWTDLGATDLNDELMLKRYENLLESILKRYTRP